MTTDNFIRVLVITIVSLWVSGFAALALGAYTGLPTWIILTLFYVAQASAVISYGYSLFTTDKETTHGRRRH